MCVPRAQCARSMGAEAGYDAFFFGRIHADDRASGVMYIGVMYIGVY